jgi:hypothetical protein
MRRLIPTPAMIVACFALVLCLGGVGYAAGKIGTRDIANNAVISVKIKDGTIAPADLSATTVKALTVRAYADITLDASFVPSFSAERTKGFATVTRPKKGVYCLTLTDPEVDPATTAPVVGVDWDSSAGANLGAYLSKSAHDCPEGTDLGVRTFAFAAGADFKPSNTVAFTILVP